jgi:hypothetical protein
VSSRRRRQTVVGAIGRLPVEARRAVPSGLVGRDLLGVVLVVVSARALRHPHVRTQSWKNWVLAHSRTIAPIALMLVGVFSIGKGSYDLATS